MKEIKNSKIREFAMAIKVIAIVIITLFTAINCANRGTGPQGGPKDTTPPKIQKTNPENGTLNYTNKSVTLFFDEIVLLESSSEKVVISPPQTKAATMKALGSKISVTLNDTLKENTTYTIDFSDAIVDNNEKNKLDGYSFCFSTGDQIDTLKISGIVIDASTLNPVSGILVGIHSNLEDSAFTSLPFDRITRTNSKGEFTVNNIKEGSYKLYALKDAGSNYKLDASQNEQLAFNDSIYIPTCSVTMISDTTFRADTLDTALQVIDTIITYPRYTYSPIEITMQAFTETNIRQYLAESARPERYKFTLTFGAPCDTLPEVSLVDSTRTLNYYFQPNETNDTLTYWLNDTTDIKSDTLRIQAKYQKTINDTLRWQTDTLRLLYRAPKARKGETPKAPQLISSNASQLFEIYKPLDFNFMRPVEMNREVSYILEEQINDSTWKKIVGAEIEPVDSFGLKYRIEHKWKESTTYRAILDSALFFTLDSIYTDSTAYTLKTKALDTYGKLIFTFINHTGYEVVQIISQDEKIIAQQQLTPDSLAHNQLTFEYMTPGTVYAKLFVDSNQNGEWDTGEYATRRQAEQVYYFPYSIELRALWDVEEEWDIIEVPLLEQKPTELMKDNSSASRGRR